MRKRKQTIWKWLIAVLLLAAGITLLVTFIKRNSGVLPEGKWIAREDGYLLYTYLYGTDAKVPSFDLGAETDYEEYLTFHEMELMFSLLEEQFPIYEGEIENIKETYFTKQYKADSPVLAEDFFPSFHMLWSVLHPDTLLYKEQGLLLAYGKDVRELDDTPVAENQVLLAKEGDNKLRLTLYDTSEALEGREDFWQNPLYTGHSYLAVDGVLLFDMKDYGERTVMGYDEAELGMVLDEEIRLKEETAAGTFLLPACWISSNQPGALWITYSDYQFCIEPAEEGVHLQDGSLYEAFEDVADFHFEEGKLFYIVTYDNRISGKLLSVSDDRIELEGLGFYSYDENLPVYKLYGQREYYTKTDLKIGYDFTDFVLDADGMIVAGLVTREERMDTIRVVIKTTEFASAYHESISFTCDSDFLLNEERHLAGEVITINPDDERFINERMYIRPETNLARTSITSIQRSQGTPAYRGNFEIAKTSDGLLLINELLLEEYLYSVVPSEMPASYPTEALKAQAVSARTYAYQRMLRSGIKKYGAHVDDSAAFQVYNNIQESETTTIAIRETQGLIAVKNGDLAESYYYSTSCGFGTDIDTWHSSNGVNYDYLVARHLNPNEEAGPTAEQMTQEETLRNYLSNVNENDFESGEGWYRWQYDTDLNIDRLNDNLLKRYEADTKCVLVLNASGNYTSAKPPTFTEINRIVVVKRESGGVIDELVIEGKEGTVKVIGEHAVRYVLANDGNEGGNKVTRNNASDSSVTTMIPSAFCFLDVEVDPETNAVIAYRVTGGGFGHGIGLSQNGARAMALAGWDYETILRFFYDGIDLVDQYEVK